MKNWIIAALLINGIAFTPAFADDKEDHYKQGTQGVSPEAIRPEYLDRMKSHNDKMEQHLKEMEKLMEKMHTTKNAKERHKLMTEHSRSMREMMTTMRGSSDEMKMGMMSGGPRGGAPMPEGEKLRQHLLEKRIDMMNMMMEQMMKSQDMSGTMH